MRTNRERNEANISRDVNNHMRCGPPNKKKLHIHTERAARQKNKSENEFKRKRKDSSIATYKNCDCERALYESSKKSKKNNNNNAHMYILKT